MMEYRDAVLNCTSGKGAEWRLTVCELSYNTIKMFDILGFK